MFVTLLLYGYSHLSNLTKSVISRVLSYTPSVKTNNMTSKNKTSTITIKVTPNTETNLYDVEFNIEGNTKDLMLGVSEIIKREEEKHGNSSLKEIFTVGIVNAVYSAEDQDEMLEDFIKEKSENNIVQ